MKFEMPRANFSEGKKEAKEAKPEFNWENFKELDAIEVPIQEVAALALSQDGKFFISSKEKSVKVFNAHNGQEVFQFDSPTELSSMAINRNGTFIGLDEVKDFRFFDVRSGSEFRKFVPVGAISSFNLSPDGRIIFASEEEGIKEYDPKIRESRILFPLPEKEKASVMAVSPDFKVAYFSKAGRLHVIDLATKSHDFSMELDQKATALNFAPDGKLLVGFADGTIKVLDSKAGEEIKTLEGHSAEVLSLAATSENRIVSASRDGSVRSWGTN